MPLNPDNEPPIDLSLSYYLEQRALELAEALAVTPEQIASVTHLRALRTCLMTERDAFHRLSTQKRHARGEIYSAARVAAINAMGPDLAELDECVRSLYRCQPDVNGILRAHALTHFAHGLMSSRLLVGMNTPDIRDAARVMQAQEEAFATAWVEAIGDPDFARELQQKQREALAHLRTASRPMYLVTQPDTATLDEADATTLGKAWSKLDSLAQTLNVAPLSYFILVPGESPEALATQVLTTTDALTGALADAKYKLPVKRAVVAALSRLQDRLAIAAAQDGRAGFEIEI